MSSESHLPGDLSDWPTAPHHVLDVEPDADKRTVRRAYARLLRLYRPDDDAAKFNRILEARDQLVRAAEYRERYREDDQPHTEPTALSEVIEFAARPDHEAPPDYEARPDHVDDSLHSESPPATVAPESPAVTAWQHAVDGEPELAYRQFQTIVSTDASAAVQLYWLARLFPNLTNHAEQRRPVDWLLDYSTDLSWYVFYPLFYEAAAKDESIFADPRVRRLIETHGTEALELFTLRWRHAVRVGLRNIIVDDLELASRSLNTKPDAWTLLACWAISLTTDARFDSLLKKYLDDLRHADWGYSWLPVGSVDEVLEIADESRATMLQRRATTSFDWIFQLLLAAPLHNVLEKYYWEETLAEWWSMPDIILARLDNAAKQTPFVVQRLHRAFLAHIEYDHHRVVAAAAVMISQMQQARRYSRAQAAAVCKTFLVPCESILSQIAAQPPVDQTRLNKSLTSFREDYSLHVLVAGWCVYAEPQSVASHAPNDWEISN